MCDNDLLIVGLRFVFTVITLCIKKLYLQLLRQEHIGVTTITPRAHRGNNYFRAEFWD